MAHALLTNPLRVLDANIFYPHTATLTYSEANIAAGAIAMPAYWWTGSAFAANNFAVLASFVLSGCGMYALARYLTGDWRAAGITAIAFAYCPYALAKLDHIQLLMTAGIPLAALAFHRLADAPSPRRGLALGLALAAQVWACAYYAVFVAIMTVGLSLATAFLRRTWNEMRYWWALAIAAVTSSLLAVPLLLPYIRLQQSGFGRTLEESREYSASLATYLASQTYASAWIRPTLDPAARPYDVLFPGFVLLAFGFAALAMVRNWRRADRDGQGKARRAELVTTYGVMGVLAVWLSLGPAGGLYTLSYQLPVFSFLRAPSRFGILAILALSVLAALAIADLLKRARNPIAITFALLALVVAEHVFPSPLVPVPVIAPAYSFLATQPRGAVLEVPPFSRPAYERTRHMINSTAHWFPMVNGYSDFIPQDFLDNVPAYADFPSETAFSKLPAGLRYVVFTLSHYKGEGRAALEAKLNAYEARVRRVYADDQNWVYEIIEP